MSILERIIEILKDKGFNGNLLETDSLKSLEIDSTEWVDICMTLESKFGISAENGLSKDMTLQQLVTYIENAEISNGDRC